jgi:ABC-type maltose transport system permease subunit
MRNPELVPMMIIFFMVIPFVLLVVALKVIAFWKICSRVGYAGPLGLLMLVPFGDIILPLFIAYAKWPALEKQLKEAAESQ